MKQYWNIFLKSFLGSFFIIVGYSSFADHFLNYSHEGGFMQSHIISLAKSEDGYLWFGSYNGLHRFDGGNLENYFPLQGDTTSLPHKVVTSIHNGENNTLWVGTRNGVSLFNPITKTFKNIDSLKGIHVKDLLLRNSEELWVASYGQGVFRYNLKSKKLDSFRLNQKGKELKYTNVLFVDQKSNLWVGVERGGIAVFNEDKSQFVSIDWSEHFSKKLPTIMSICQSSSGDFWIGTWGDGVLRYTPSSRQLIQYLKNIRNDLTLPSNVVRDVLYEKEQDKIWIATNKGLVSYELNTKTEALFVPEDNDPNSLSFGDLWALCLDEQSNLWIGTFGDGLAVKGRKANLFKTINQALGYQLDSDYSRAMFQDSKGRIWNATSAGGVSVYEYDSVNVLGNKLATFFTGSAVTKIYEAKDGKFWVGGDQLWVISKSLKSVRTIFLHEEKEFHPHYKIFEITEDNQNRIWLGGWQTDLVCINLTNGANRADIQYFPVPGNIKYNDKRDRIISLFTDDKNRLWVAHANGVSWFDLDQMMFSKHDSSIGGMYFYKEPDASVLWIAGSNSYLARYDLDKERLDRKLYREDLLGRGVNNFLGADSTLWFTSEHGLVQLTFSEDAVNYYSQAEGILGTLSNQNTIIRLRDGKILFATNRGLVSFSPSDFSSHKAQTPIHLTDVLVYGQSLIDSTNRLPIQMDGDRGRVLRLAYDQNHIQFQFSTLSLIKSGYNSYRYRLKGFDKEWLYSSERNVKATYTNLPYGTFELEVESLTPNGKIASSKMTLVVEVVTPFWATWWFKVGCVAILSLVGICLVRMRVNEARNRREKLEDEVKKATEKVRAVNDSLRIRNLEIELKSKRILDQKKKLEYQKKMLLENNKRLNEVSSIQTMLFSVLGHDLNSPLQSQRILFDYLEQADSDEERKEIFAMLKRAQDNLIFLTSDLLNWATVHETDQLEKQEVDVEELIHYNIENIAIRSNTKGIQIKPNLVFTGRLLFQKRIIETVLRNVLTNAVKFSPVNSVIYIHVDQCATGELKIDVIDKGPGFSKKQIERIFESDLELEERSSEGFGVGLKICLRLLEKIDAKLMISSDPRVQTTVSIVFPFQKVVPIFDDKLEVS